MSFTFFNQAVEDLFEKIHNLGSDTFKVAIVTNATVPTASTAAPHWGGTGTTDFSANEIAGTGAYTTGGETCANVTSAQTSGTYKLDFDNISWAKNASSPTNGCYGILYNSTDTNKRALGFITLNGGSAVDMTAGALTIVVDASNGLFTSTPA